MVIKKVGNPQFILFLYFQDETRWEKGSHGMTHCGIAWSYIIDMLNTLKSAVQVINSLDTTELQIYGCGCGYKRESKVCFFPCL